MKIALPARPEPIEIDREHTAVLLVDMQNAFASRGGMLDLAGIDVEPAAQAVANARVVADAARAAGVPVIYLVMGYAGDRSNAGGEDSPNPRKRARSLPDARAPGTARNAPDLRHLGLPDRRRTYPAPR